MYARALPLLERRISDVAGFLPVSVCVARCRLGSIREARWQVSFDGGLCTITQGGRFWLGRIKRNVVRIRLLLPEVSCVSRQKKHLSKATIEPNPLLRTLYPVMLTG